MTSKITIRLQVKIMNDQNGRIAGSKKATAVAFYKNISNGFLLMKAFEQLVALLFQPGAKQFVPDREHHSTSKQADDSRGKHTANGANKDDGHRNVQAPAHQYRL